MYLNPQLRGENKEMIEEPKEGSPFHGRYRSARVQRFEARNSARAKLRVKKARRAARRARARNRS